MFINERPFGAVAAGLAVALLVVCLDRACASLPASAAEKPPADAPCAACAAHAAWGIVRAGS
jgi:hypothetical protein